MLDNYKTIKQWLVFLAGGAVIAVVVPLVQHVNKINEEQALLINAADISQLRDDFSELLKREPGQAELEAMIERRIDDEILVQEAIKLSLHLHDPVVRERLVMNMRFLKQQEGDDEALFQKAIDLGMVKTDLVVRRRLLERMESLIVSNAVYEPNDAMLRDYLSRYSEQFSIDKSYSLQHYWFPKHEFSSLKVQQVYHQWSTGDLTGEQLGEMASNQFVDNRQWLTPYSLEKVLGPVISKTIMNSGQPGILPMLETEAAYHLVRIEDIRFKQLPDFDLIRDRLRQEWLTDMKQKAIENQLAVWREKYNVTIVSKEGYQG